MPSSKLLRDGIIDYNGDIEYDKLSEKLLNDSMYLAPDPPPPPLKRRRTRTEKPRRDYKRKGKEEEREEEKKRKENLQ